MSCRCVWHWQTKKSRHLTVLLYSSIKYATPVSVLWIFKGCLYLKILSFRNIMQCHWVTNSQHFVQIQSTGFKLLDPLRWRNYVALKHPQSITLWCRIISQNGILNHTALQTLKFSVYIYQRHSPCLLYCKLLFYCTNFNIDTPHLFYRPSLIKQQA